MTAWDNPAGTDGFEFVEYTAPDTQALHALPAESPWSQIAYAAKSCDVKHVAVDGRLVVRDRALLTLDVEMVRANAKRAATRLFSAA